MTSASLAAADFGNSVGRHPVQILVADHQNKPDMGAAIAREWFDKDGVDVVVDIGNSAVAMAVLGLVTEKNRVYLASAPSSNAITGEACSPNVVQWADNYMLASAITKALQPKATMGWFFITADYSFGHDLQDVASKLIASSGGKVDGSVLHPPGSTDFSSYLISASSSGASVVALANAGTDTTNAIKQAQEFGIGTGKTTLAAFQASITTVGALGVEQSQGLYVTEPFYWDLNESTRAFSKRYFSKMDSEPNYAQATAYSAVWLFLSTIQRDPGALGDGREVVKDMKKESYRDPILGLSSIRADGRVIHDTYLFQVKTPSESQAKWDVYKLVSTVSGSDAALPAKLSKCPLMNHAD